MIQFKEINGTLCRMLEQPIPLTEDAKFPCVVRLIQDDSPMGGYNRMMETAYTLRRTVTALRVFSDSNMEAKDILLPAGSYNRFEILGYPVADGSKEWALYHALAGKVLTMDESAIYKIQDGKLWECFPNDSNEWRVVADDGIGYWLKYINDPTGWHLYEPYHFRGVTKMVESCPTCNGTGKVEKPAPAFKVGDWVTDGVINGSITSLTDDLAWVKTEFYEYRMSLRNLTPISPSDVVVDFGSFRGTIELNSHPFRKQITVKNTQGDAIAYINIVFLDTPTRELVRELIEKQEGDAK
jgi:hypothetical protein